MTSYLHIILDTAAPANPAILLNEGAPVTGAQVVQVTLSTDDYEGGQEDVAQMKIWGDVDPTADPLVQPTEGASSWQTFLTSYAVKLAAGDGRKYVRARLRDDVRNETLEFSDFIDLASGVPVVDITTGVDRSRISKISPFHQATFIWESSLPFTEYRVRVVPNAGSPYQAGAPIGSAGGSLNVGGTGSFAADTPITTTIRGADLEVASPGDTTKIVKVFVKGEDGLWSP